MGAICALIIGTVLPYYSRNYMTINNQRVQNGTIISLKNKKKFRNWRNKNKLLVKKLVSWNQMLFHCTIIRTRKKLIYPINLFPLWMQSKICEMVYVIKTHFYLFDNATFNVSIVYNILHLTVKKALVEFPLYLVKEIINQHCKKSGP